MALALILTALGAVLVLAARRSRRTADYRRDSGGSGGSGEGGSYAGDDCGDSGGGDGGGVD